MNLLYNRATFGVYLPNSGTSAGVRKSWQHRKRHLQPEALESSKKAIRASKVAYSSTSKVYHHQAAARSHEKAAELTSQLSQEHPNEEMRGYYKQLSEQHDRQSQNHRELATQHKQFPKEKSYILEDTDYNIEHGHTPGKEVTDPPEFADLVVKGHPWRKHEEEIIEHEAKTAEAPWAVGDKATFGKSKGTVLSLLGQGAYKRVALQLETGKKTEVHIHHPSLKRVSGFKATGGLAREVEPIPTAAKPDIAGKVKKPMTEKEAKAKRDDWLARIKTLGNRTASTIKCEEDDIPAGHCLDCGAGCVLHKNEKGSYWRAEPSRIPGRMHHQFISKQHAKRIIKIAKARGAKPKVVSNREFESILNYDYGVSSEQNQPMNYLQTGDPDNPIKGTPGESTGGKMDNLYNCVPAHMISAMKKEYGDKKGESVAIATWKKEHEMNNSEPHSCAACGGSGAKDRTSCPSCGGTGRQNVVGVEEKLPAQSPETLTYLRERPVGNRLSHAAMLYLANRKKL